MRNLLPLLCLAFLLSACGSLGSKRGHIERNPGNGKAVEGGGYYQDDGPGANTPDNLDQVTSAIPREEPIRRAAARPYTVLGQSYQPMTGHGHYREEGVASWYGRKFHGKKTASGEPYDMYAMTAAHKTLPIPSYAKVARADGSRSVIVRVNDRGPFLHGRIIDLSYTAAHQLGLVGRGSGHVVVELIQPEDYARYQQPAATSPVIAQAAPQETPAPQKDDNLGSWLTERGAARSADPAVQPVIAIRRGIYLQYGAFQSAENAESFRQRLAADLNGQAGQVELFAGGGFYRVQSGPYPDRESALRLAEHLQAEMAIAPQVMVR